MLSNVEQRNTVYTLILKENNNFNKHYLNIVIINTSGIAQREQLDNYYFVECCYDKIYYTNIHVVVILGN